MHTDASPASELFAKGDGDWPATQQARPHGVYDTELGRMALHASCTVSSSLDAKLREMGAEVIIAPPEAGAPFSRAAVTLAAAEEHSNFSRYEVCGPDPLPNRKSDSKRHITVTPCQYN